MEELNVTEKEILNEVLRKIDMLFRVKYSSNMENALDREIELCKITLGSYNQINIEELESKYKND